MKILTDEEIKNILGANFDFCPNYENARAIEAAVLEKLAKQEPVAWVNSDTIQRMHRDSRFNMVQWQTALCCTNTFEGQVPLYAAPQPAAAADVPCSHDWSFDREASDGSEAQFACNRCGKELIVSRNPTAATDDMNLARHLEREKCSRKAEECVEELRIQLAGRQAREVQLREALGKYRDSVLFRIGSSSPYRQVANEYFETIKPILTTTQDTSALSAIIAKAGEVMRKRCIEVAYATFPDGRIRAIPVVTLEDLKGNNNV